MSFVKIDNNNFEYNGLSLRPSIHFISSSIGLGVTGSSYVTPIRPTSFKKLKVDTFDLDGDGSVSAGELIQGIFNSPELFLKSIIDSNYTLDLNSKINAYLTSVNNADQISKNSKVIDMFRFDQPIFYDQNKNIKNIVRKNLMPFYKHSYHNCNFAYSNYHSLNFFKSETIPTGSALLYANIEDTYSLPDNFSINFWINPRYTENINNGYKPGTILHISSSIAISLVTGSSINSLNESDNFKLLVQLSQSADIPPSIIDINNPSNSYPYDLIFTSSFNLNKNNWHHVTVQWSNTYNNSTGSIFIDDNETKFYIPSSSISSVISPTALVIGNYYDGEANNLGYIMNSDLASVEGFDPGFIGSTVGTITSETFSHPLQAEIHEIKIYDKILKSNNSLFEDERQIARKYGNKNKNNLVFYLPPYFYPDTPVREVLQSPFQTVTSTTDDPINVAFSFGVNGKSINLENFVKELVNDRYPRLLGLFPETINSTIQNITPDQFIYDTGSNKKRNMTILPNDNGLFIPDYSLIANSYVSESIKFIADQSNKTCGYDYSLINLENLIPSSSLYPGLVQSQGSIFDSIISASAQNPGVSAGSVLTIAQRTRDLASNEIVIFDISNLYYGNQIHPRSFHLYEKDLTGSDGKIQINVKDNGLGSLYRADCLTKQAEWNSIGNLFYNEGICLIKTPHLMYLCKDETNIKFRGEQNIHTMLINVPAFKEMFNSSSNPTYVPIAPTNNLNDEHLSTLYITTVNIHDDNLNIIMKANFSQPIFKTEEDEFIIRLKEDF